MRFLSLGIEKKIVDNVNMVGTITSKSVDISKMSIAAFQFVWTGTPTGTIDLQVSIDGVEWTDVNSGADNPAGSADSTVIEIMTASKYVRGIYTHTSGSGNLTINFSGTRG